ncbi:MAG: hypothetical protein AAGG02_08070 [Cyanobacteria bacterium P01_H01_bin.15]
MSQTERLIQLAEDELTRYSTDALKMERLRRKIGISLSPSQQEKIKEEIMAEMPSSFWGKIVEDQRQMIALPFWGIAGLGLLFGISFRQPFDFMATAIAAPIAVNIQRWGWQLQAKRLVLNTLKDIEKRVEDATKS